MEALLPKSFIQALAGALTIIAILLAIASIFPKFRTHAARLSAVMFISSLALFSNHWATYFAGLFIIATAVTELEFLESLAAIIRGSKHYFDYKIAGNIQAPEEDKVPDTGPIEYKILNTLWTKQVTKFPDFSKVFTFRINANASDYVEYRAASSKLIGEKLISETDFGQIHLTQAGFEYCKEHYKEFPPDQWWPKDTIDKENLKRVTGEA